MLDIQIHTKCMLIGCLSVRLLANSRLLVVKFWGSQKLQADFQLHGGLVLLCCSRVNYIH